MSGFLAMLGGETLPEAPFITPFNMMDPTAHTPDSSALGFADEMGTQDVRIQASELGLVDPDDLWEEYRR